MMKSNMRARSKELLKDVHFGRGWIIGCGRHWYIEFKADGGTGVSPGCCVMEE